MTTETDLLPLPEPVAVKYPDSGLRDDDHALRLWAAHGYDTGGEPLFSAEQLREATAPLQAEVEELRAEVERWRVPCREWLDKTEWVQQTVKPRELGHHRADILRQRIEQAEARAERLAELLDQAHGHVPAGALADQIHCALLRFALTIADAELSNGEAEMSDHHVTDAMLRDQEEGK